jgi:hypothetical protein
VSALLVPISTTDISSVLGTGKKQHDHGLVAAAMEALAN